ncbi:hypothetical protein [Nocardiopsis alba]|uniref:hypothetical protein n=1 Tax=Nocardiopsis alba TaxID=53437 RepID=UPI0035E1B1BB
MSDLARTRAETLANILYAEHDLDGAVGRARAQERSRSEDPWSHYVLGLALGMRYIGSDDPADIEGALEHLERAIRLGGENDPHAADFRQQLAGALSIRWTRALMDDPDTDPSELAGALELAREALEMTEENSPHLPVRSMQVAEFLAQGAAGPEGLTEALGLTERALAMAHPDDPRLSRFQHAHAQIMSRIASQEDAPPGMALAAENSAMRAGHLAPAYDPTQLKIFETIRTTRLLRIRSAG